MVASIVDLWEVMEGIFDFELIFIIAFILFVCDYKQKIPKLTNISS